MKIKYSCKALVSVALIVIIFVAGTSLGLNAANIPSAIQRQPALNQYTINAILNPTDKTLTATQTVKYINNENVELNELYFHVYANTFKSNSTAPFMSDDFNAAYKKGFSPGYTDMISVNMVFGKVRIPLKVSFQGFGGTIMKIPLPIGLNPKGAVTLEMSYKIYLPPASDRFGYDENVINLGNWYPIAAVYDGTGWNLDKYYPIGDPFYSDCSNYTVQITAPSEYIIAASGALVSEKKQSEQTISTFKAEKMRDFAIVTSNKFKVLEQKVDDITIKSYCYKEDIYKGERALKFGVDSIKTFNKAFGKYPYPVYSVVETAFPTGMEYPGLVYIGDSCYPEFEDEFYFEKVIAHETAHQWWYSLIGDDQIDEAWLDESFAAYSEKIYYEDNVGEDYADAFFEQYVEKRAAYGLKNHIIEKNIVKPLSQFKNWTDYTYAAYKRGPVVLNELRKELGDEVFFNILQTYFNKFEYKIATTQDFIKVCNKVSGQDLTKFFNEWLYGK